MTDQRFKKVRIKATGEVGYISHIGASEFFAQTHLPDYNFRAVHVLMDATGEIRTYLKAVIEDVAD